MDLAKEWQALLVDLCCIVPVQSSSGTFKSVKVFCLIFPWVLALAFQAQLVLLQREFAAIKLQLFVLSNSTAEGGKKSLSKRSVGESYKEAVKKVSGTHWSCRLCHPAAAVRPASNFLLPYDRGTEAAHFRGTFPFQKIEKNGRIGPWSLLSPDNAFVVLKAKNTELEFTVKGIYHVYAQIYYLTNQSSNSYQILTYNGTEQRENHRTLSTCACQGGNTMGEVSCYTGFTGTFDKGHRVYLHQIEQNRIINNSNGCSFFGTALLRKSAENSKRKASRM